MKNLLTTKNTKKKLYYNFLDGCHPEGIFAVACLRYITNVYYVDDNCEDAYLPA